jgi:hypothetical protein
VEYERLNGLDGVWTAALDEVFDHDWLNEQIDVQHVVAKGMLGPPYSVYTRGLANIADLVCAVKQGGPGAASVLRRLQVHEQFRGACAEASVARLIHEAGLPFLFDIAKGEGQSYDITVGGPRPFAVEVKSRVRSERAMALDAVQTMVMMEVSHVAMGCRLSLDWSGDEARTLPLGGDFPGRIRTLANRTATAILGAVMAERGPPASRLEIALPGLGVATLHRDAAAPNHFEVDDRSDPHLEARRFAASVVEAAPQLKGDLPGVVFVCAGSQEVDPEAMVVVSTELFERQGMEMPQISGVILLRNSGVESIREETHPIPNPHASVSLADIPLAEAQHPAVRERWVLAEPFGMVVPAPGFPSAC